MIWAKHAELNAIGKARAELRRARGRARRAPDLGARRRWPGVRFREAATGSGGPPRISPVGGGRMERKIKRIEVRIAAAGRTVNDLRMARELGREAAARSRQISLTKRASCATSARPAREAVMRFPLPARQSADRAPEQDPQPNDRPRLHPRSVGRRFVSSMTLARRAAIILPLAVNGDPAGI